VKAAPSKRTDPLRLVRRRGSWSLEYTRLVSVDEHILRPERLRATATPALLRSLGESCPPVRIDEAVALLNEADDGSERAFELAADGWAETPIATPSQRPQAQSELKAMLADTQTQLAVLRGLYDALLSRVAALESNHAQAQRSLPPRVVRRVPSRKSVFDSLKYGSPGERAPRSVPPEAPLPVAQASAFDPSRAVLAPAVRPAAPESPPPAVPSPDATLASSGAAALTMQGSRDLVTWLQMLADDVEVTPTKANAPHDLGDFYVALLADESDEVIAAWLFNQRTAAELGAGILGGSVEERNQQAQGELTSDSLDGLNEVANNLTGLLNRTNPKRSVKFGALERAPQRAPEWLKNPAKLRAFSLRESGSLFLLVR